MNHFREPVNGFTHLAGALLSALGLIWLIAATWGETAKLLSVLVYGLCMMALYLASATFHLATGSERRLKWLLRFDHAAIYLLIAGTYTPFCYNMLEGAWRWGMLALVWGCAMAGIVYKLLRLQAGSRWSLIFYVLMGWLGLLVLPQALARLPVGAILLILAGGAAYSIGAVFFGLQKPNFHRYFGHHELWHVCVLAGSAFHFIAIMAYIV
ncbi:MAG TPA: hemolysin III family protein [Phototrophicaceae bacterium]|nr:hemolysin III family protein [Phototrophicaceae bacterium]